MTELSLAELHNKRRVVVHHTHILKDQILQILKPKDLVFFDDCLFSQYKFITENLDFFKKNEIKCILGFSASLYAPEDADEQLCKIESHILHDACNRCIQTVDDADKIRSCLPEMNGFMKVSQVKELLQQPFMCLALHGCCHLDLATGSILDRAKQFQIDLNAGMQRLECFGLRTSMYIYPYVHSLPLCDKMLARAQMRLVVGSKIFRVAVEDLALDDLAYQTKCNS